MNYLPVRLKTLNNPVPLGFKVYVKLPHKYLAYCSEEYSIEPERLNRLKKSKVKKLWILDSDELKYQNYLENTLNAIANSDEVSGEQKAEFATGIGGDAAEKVFEKPESRESYQAAQNAAKGLVEILSKNDDVLSHIFNRENSEGDDQIAEIMQSHAVNTSSLAVRFASYQKIDPSELESIGVAGLYHDSGFVNYEKDEQAWFLKPVSELSVAEYGKYKEHPIIATELLQDKDYATKEVIDLIATHEERISGEGFPNKLSSLTETQELLALCAAFDREVTCMKKDTAEVVQDFSINQIGQFNLDLIKSFKKFLKSEGLAK